MQSTASQVRTSQIFGAFGLALFLAVTIWINYEVKVVFLGAGSGAVSELGNLKLGQPAPDFSALDLSNRLVSLAGDYRGKKVVLLDFWATWCGPCRMEMVDLKTFQDKFKGNGLVILSVNQGENADIVQKFLTRKGYDFHALLDANGEVSNHYGVKSIPTLVLIDQQGIIQWLQVGYSAKNQKLEEKIASLTGK